MISAVVLVKDQSEQLKKCLRSLSWCDEVVVIDDYSTDDSLDVAKKMGARVFQRDLNNNFSEQRNFGMGKAKNQWVFFVDADEIVSSALAKEIHQHISQFLSTANGFFVKRTDYLWGRRLGHGEVGDKKLLRIGKKGKGEWVGSVHEEWRIFGETGTFVNELSHYPHQSIREFLSEINRYSTIRAKELHEKNIKYPAISTLLYPSGKFLLNYVVKRGFQDGVPGMIVALMMSFHSFLVRGKLWQEWNTKKRYTFEE